MKKEARAVKFVGGIAAALALALASPAGAADGPGFGLFGIKVAVRDFQKAINFYSALGMKPGPRPNPQRWQLQWDGPYRGANIMMVLDQAGTNPARSHASLMIHVPDVHEAAARLRASGHTSVGEPKVTPRATILIVEDPDGNEVELLGPSRK